jgi:hypothetical protein
MISPVELQTLIYETKALKFDFPILVVLDEPTPNKEAFALIGKVLSLKPINTQIIRHTLAISCSFVVPIVVESIDHNKFLLGVSDMAHMDTILNKGPWNIRGSLLLLKQWSLELAITEIELTHCPFWVQIHGLPRQNMALQNAIMIGKALGKILAPENMDTSGHLRRQFLRVKVDIDTGQALKPGFHLPRPGKSALWISFRYERLCDYCPKCGVIGHKKLGCPHRPDIHFPLAQYSIPLY